MLDPNKPLTGGQIVKILAGIFGASVLMLWIGLSLREAPSDEPERVIGVKILDEEVIPRQAHAVGQEGLLA